MLSSDNSRGPVVLLGFDAGDPELIERWASEGRLPALARLMARGSWARTGGPELLFEHGIWLSLFSGVSIARHGFHFFWQPRPGTYELELVRGADAGTAPFWAHLRGTERAVFVMDPPDTSPVRGIPGMQVSEWATHSHYPPLTLAAEPPEAADQVERLFGPREPIGETIGSGADDDRRTLDRLLARTGRKGACVRALLAERSYDLVVAVFAEAHTGGHQVWEYRRDAKGDGPRPSADMGDGLLRLYEAVDREIGAIVDALPPTADVFVVSSVGLQSQYPIEGLTEALCRGLGYQAAPAAGPERRRSPLDVLRGLIPTPIRDALSRRLPFEVQARLFSQKFVGATDWSRTTAYAPPGYYTGCVRVNLRGREPQGIVEPGAAYDEVLDRLEADFHALTHPETGEPVVARTVRPRELFGAAVHPALPDLYVSWRAHDRPLLRVLHPRAELTQPRHHFHRGSHHTVDGFLVGAGPSVRAAGRMPEVSPLALAPTLLSLLGVTPPGAMEGAPLGDWLIETAVTAPAGALRS
jgi:predicted AlkP superfamily phosphohydrolase/phosphomutase